MTPLLEQGFQLRQPLSAAGWNLLGLWLLERGNPAETQHPCTLWSCESMQELQRSRWAHRSHPTALPCRHERCHPLELCPRVTLLPWQSVSNGFETTKMPFGLGCSGACKGPEGMEGLCPPEAGHSLSLLVSLPATCPPPQWHMHP